MGSATFGVKAPSAAIVIALAIVLQGLLAHPGAAQLSIGSPGDPPSIALGGGAFDITPGNGNTGGGTAGEIRAEYRYGNVLWPISPFVGVSGTSGGAFYGYGGFGIDINFTPNLVLTPSVAGGYFEHGSGTNLGSWWEFRTGVELAWRFTDRSRLGVTFHHTSNAGLAERNPGAQSVMLMYSVPLR